MNIEYNCYSVNFKIICTIHSLCVWFVSKPNEKYFNLLVCEKLLNIYSVRFIRIKTINTYYNEQSYKSTAT